MNDSDSRYDDTSALEAFLLIQGDCLGAIYTLLVDSKPFSLGYLFPWGESLPHEHNICLLNFLCPTV